MDWGLLVGCCLDSVDHSESIDVHDDVVVMVPGLTIAVLLRSD